MLLGLRTWFQISSILKSIRIFVFIKKKIKNIETCEVCFQREHSSYILFLVKKFLFTFSRHQCIKDFQTFKNCSVLSKQTWSMFIFLPQDRIGNREYYENSQKEIRITTRKPMVHSPLMMHLLTQLYQFSPASLLSGSGSLWNFLFFSKLESVLKECHFDTIDSSTAL